MAYITHTLGLLFQMKVSQSFSLQTTILDFDTYHLVGSCFLGIALYFKITRKSNFIPYHLLTLPTLVMHHFFFISQSFHDDWFCTHFFNTITRWHMKPKWCIISTTQLAHQITMIYIQSNQTCLQSNLLFSEDMECWQNEVPCQNPSWHIIHMCQLGRAAADYLVLMVFLKLLV